MMRDSNLFASVISVPHPSNNYRSPMWTVFRYHVSAEPMSHYRYTYDYISRRCVYGPWLGMQMSHLLTDRTAS